MCKQIKEFNTEQQMDAPTRDRLGKIWYLIGLAWQCGDVLDENERLAVDSFRRAAGYGNAEAMRCLANICIYRDRDLMKARLIDGICFEPLADRFNLSVTQTKRIVYKLEKRIFKYLR